MVKSHPKIVKADVSRFQQMLYNLVSNALKFTKGGKVDVYVKFKSDYSMQSSSIDDKVIGHLEVLVKDTGIGIANEDIPKLFKPFSKLDAGKTLNPNGTGLGLSVVKNIAKALNGTASVTSVKGKGSDFKFKILGGVDMSPVEFGLKSPMSDWKTIELKPSEFFT